MSQDALFALLESWKRTGAQFAPLTAIDDFVDARAGGIFLKHDVHDLNLDRLVAFAERENKLGIKGTYFFMPPEHPRTRKAYRFAAQISAMKAVAGLGHELGLHIDPYFLISQDKLPLRDILERLLDAFGKHGIAFRVGNMHGNSAHKHLDLDGYGTSFDLFDELARQQDYPALARVFPDSAEIIRSNRISLAEFGITHWADMPVWSARYGFVVTNFLTDNYFGKQGTYELVTSSQTDHAYQICEKQFPGALNRTEGRTIAIEHSSNRAFEAVHEKIALTDGTFVGRYGEADHIMPLLVLLHPEFYV